MNILVPTAPGDLIDRLTILRLKSEQITDPQKLSNVRYELTALQAIADDTLPITTELKSLWGQLADINRDLWQIENDIREHETEGDFGDGFVALARSVYLMNDKRVAIKKQVNMLLGSAIVEEKSYTDRSPA